jgi:membrane fusion protein (multidrug efflux system)
MTRRVLALLSLAGMVACGGSEEETPPAVVGAETAIAALQPFTETSTAVGMVAPRPRHFAAMAAPAPTRVANIYVAVGTPVQPGDSLVGFERGPFDAQAQSAEVALTAAQHAYDRAVRLSQAGVLSRRELEQADADLAQAKANAVSARRSQELATLRSPIAGVVTAMRAVLGAPADPAQPLVEIADPRALDALLTTTPAEAARIKRGAAASITAGESDQAEALGTGVVVDIAAAVDSVTRGVAVRVRVDRPARQMRVGETVFGSIVVGVNPRAVTVPVDALVPEGEGYRVFVVGDSSIAHARPVTVGGRSGGMAEITAGLSGGETVVTYGAYGVEDGAKIVPKKPS